MRMPYTHALEPELVALQPLAAPGALKQVLNCSPEHTQLVPPLTAPHFWPRPQHRLPKLAEPRHHTAAGAGMQHNVATAACPPCTHA